MRRGLDSKVTSVSIEAMELHVGMMQVSSVGEAKKKEIVAVMSTAVKDTKHENKKYINYAYNKLRNVEAERLQNTIVKVVENIRSQWTTYEKFNQGFDDAKPVLLKYKFTEDRKFMSSLIIF